MATIFGTNFTETIFGSALADTINGWDQANAAGDEGPLDDNDFIVGGAGNDIINGGNGNDKLWGGPDSDTLNGGAGSDDLIGGDGSGSLNSDGADTLNGGDGADRLWGETGVDTLHGGANDDELYGGLGNDIIDGGSGNDVIFVQDGDGSDTIDGGLDSDYLIFDRTSAVAGLAFSIVNPVILQNLADGTSIVNIERIVFHAGSGTDNVTGGALDDQLFGGGGADILNGGGGLDYIVGDAGNDVLDGGDQNDTVLGGADADTVNGGAGDDYVAGGDGVDHVNGSDGTDQVYGGLGNDFLDGGIGDDFIFVAADEGVDTITGGTGIDYLYLDRSTSALGFTVSLDNPAALHTLVDGTTFTEIERIRFQGSNATDNIKGGALDDYLSGGGGNDILDGGAGLDTLGGGLGNDTYYVDNASDTTDEVNGGGGVGDYVYASVSYTEAAGIERLYLTGSAEINATGVNGQNDILIGNSARNYLDGKGGADVMRGGLGNDIYYVDNVGDKVDEVNGGGGIDIVYASISYTMAAGTERLYLTGAAAVNGTGLDGQGDTLAGNGAANVLSGLSGNDYLLGGLGNDTLTGGLGLDTFRFDTLPNATTNMDTITDFTAVDDTIQLENAIFTGLGLGTGALAAGLFNTGTAATQADDRIIYDPLTGALLYDADGLNGVAGVQFAFLTGHPAITAADFVVI